MAVSEQTLDHQPALQREGSRHLPRPGRRFLLFVMTAFLGSAAVVGGLAALHQREAGRILTGVSAAGIDVGGMTPDEARSALTARLADLSAGSITIRSGIGTTTIAFADVERVPDIDAMVAEAAARGRGGSWFDETVAGLRLRLEPEAISLRLGYDHDRAAVAVAQFLGRMALNPIDATVLRGTSAFAATASTEGRRIDGAAAIAAVDQVMRDPASRAGIVIDAPVLRIAPTLTGDEAAEAAAAANRVAVPLKIVAASNTAKLKATQIRAWISFHWVDGHYRPVVDRTKIPAALKSIAKTVARPVRDAAFLRDKGGHIVGSMADRAGRKLDVAGSTAAIAAALEARAGTPMAEPVKLPVTLIAPKVTTEEAAKKAPLMVRLGGWSTYYQVSAHNGFGANISVPARYLNGTVVAPGAVFDFWDRLGEVSFRTGYRLGGAIIGGHSVEGKALAGGICAASTTLFNAALRSGFEILARQPHWYYIKRYPLGLDATVSESQTMRFRNDTPNPILIRGFASPGVVRFEIWSVPNGRTVTLSRPSVSNVVPGADSEKKTTTLPAGTTLRTEWPVDGKDVVVTRTVRNADGHLVHRDTFYSHYHRMVGILLIGIG